MATNTEQIILEFITKGQERLAQAQAELRRANETIDRVNSKTKEMNLQNEKSESIFRRAGNTIRNFRRELFAVSITIGTVIAVSRALAAASDSMASQFDKFGLSAKIALQPTGNYLAKIYGQVSGLNSLTQKGFFDQYTGAENALERDLSIRQLDRLRVMQSEVYKLRGDEAGALNRKLKLEEAVLHRDIMTLTTAQKKIYIDLFNEKKKLMTEDLRLAEFGLNRQVEITKEFKKSMVGAFTGGTSETIFNFLQGQRQSGADIMRNFTTGINRAIADALSQSLFTSLFSGNMGDFFSNFKNILTGKNATTEAVKETGKQMERKLDQLNTILSAARDCICRTAENTAAMASRGTPSFSGSLELPGQGGSWLSRIGAISGLVGSIAGLGGLFGGGSGSGGSVSTGGGNNGGFLTPGGRMPRFEVAPSLKGFGTIGHSGGPVGRYAMGGEVPAILHQGEYVVNAPATSRNRELLKDINSGATAKPQNYFIVQIKANDAKSFDDQLATPSARARMEFQINRMIMSNMDVRRVIKNFAR